MLQTYTSTSPVNSFTLGHLYMLFPLLIIPFPISYLYLTLTHLSKPNKKEFSSLESLLWVHPTPAAPFPWFLFLVPPTPSTYLYHNITALIRLLDKCTRQMSPPLCCDFLKDRERFGLTQHLQHQALDLAHSRPSVPTRMDKYLILKWWSNIQPNTVKLKMKAHFLLFTNSYFYLSAHKDKNRLYFCTPSY